jgi:hypothetical protein
MSTRIIIVVEHSRLDVTSVSLDLVSHKKHENIQLGASSILHSLQNITPGERLLACTYLMSLLGS